MYKVNMPPSLSIDDEMRIVAPASIVEKEYVDNAASALADLGYRITLGEHIFSNFHQFSGTDPDRLSDFQKALDDRNVKAIFCARGGYGSIRIMDKINFSGFRKNPKWIVGFSDITVFHSLLNCHYHIASIHSPMPVNFNSPHFSENLQQLNDILKGEPKPLYAPADPLNRNGVATGQLVGGNLSILHNLQATPFEIITDDAILFIEDVGEQLYHLDRMMQNLLLSGKISCLRGLIVGGLTDMTDKKRPFGRTPKEIILDNVRNYSFPVAFNFSAGHMANNVPFIIGGRVELNVKEKGTILSPLN
jgi:muramoyltetrapeptide carboxypeptidase